MLEHPGNSFFDGFLFRLRCGSLAVELRGGKGWGEAEVPPSRSWMQGSLGFWVFCLDLVVDRAPWVERGLVRGWVSD